MNKSDVVLIEYITGNKVSLYALRCQQCGTVEPVLQTETKLLCQKCHSLLGVIMPEDYVKNLLEGGEIH
jgi:Zn finger protein HypA/HybF involved in hydrogenase expression